MNEFLTTGGGMALIVGVAVIVFWVCVIVAFFSMANNVSKMRKELERLHAVVRVQTELIHEQQRGINP